MSFDKVLELGLGNVVCVMAAAFVLYLMFEFPFKRLIEHHLLPLVSHDDVYHLAYVRQKAAAQKVQREMLDGSIHSEYLKESNQTSKYIDVRAFTNQPKKVSDSPKNSNYKDLGDE